MQKEFPKHLKNSVPLDYFFDRPIGKIDFNSEKISKLLISMFKKHSIQNHPV